ncbi:MAG: hypothetical protein OQJ97_12150 [Rhodospirillales bacterium]|nr:hypothetical protein [Rhodospirillales bacterium]
MSSQQTETKTTRKDGFVLRSFFGAIVGAAIVSAAVVSIMGYAIFTTSEIVKMILIEMGSLFDFVYYEGGDDAAVEAMRGWLEQVAEIALVFYGIWYAFPLFIKAVFTQIILCAFKWESLSQYLIGGFLVGAAFSLRPLFFLSETIGAVSETENDIMFNAFAVEGPCVALVLFVVWYFSYEKRQVNPRDASMSEE